MVAYRGEVDGFNQGEGVGQVGDGREVHRFGQVKNVNQVEDISVVAVQVIEDVEYILQMRRCGGVVAVSDEDEQVRISKISSYGCVVRFAEV